MGKWQSKYIVSFDYFDKYLIVLSKTSGSISISSFGTAIGAPAGKASASFSFVFSMSTGIVKKLKKASRNKNKNIIKLLCQLEVNQIT